MDAIMKSCALLSMVHVWLGMTIRALDTNRWLDWTMAGSALCGVIVFAAFYRVVSR